MDRQTRMYDNFDRVEQRTIEEILNIVYDALEERGYNAIDQMVGYILSGDPSYITSHNNAITGNTNILKGSFISFIVSTIPFKSVNRSIFILFNYRYYARMSTSDMYQLQHLLQLCVLQHTQLANT